MKMGKEKKAGKNTGSKDILYRLVMAVLAACVPVAAYFCDYIYFLTQSTLFQLLAQWQGNTSDTGETYGSFSLHNIVQEILPLVQGNADDAASLGEALAPLKTPAIFVAIFFALAVVIAVVLFFFSCFSKKKTVPACIAGGGILSMIGLAISFHYMAAPILDGTVSLANLSSNAIISFLLPMVATITELRLTTGFYIMLFLFIAMILWAVANKLIEAGDKPPKQPKPKKEKKAEKTTA